MEKDARNLPKRVSTNDDITSPSTGGLTERVATLERRRRTGGGRMVVEGWGSARLLGFVENSPKRGVLTSFTTKDEGGGGEGGGRRCC